MTTAHTTPRGYYCTRCPRHNGACDLRAWWWNAPALVRWVRS